MKQSNDYWSAESTKQLRRLAGNRAVNEVQTDMRLFHNAFSMIPAGHETETTPTQCHSERVRSAGLSRHRLVETNQTIYVSYIL